MKIIENRRTKVEIEHFLRHLIVFRNQKKNIIKINK